MAVEQPSPVRDLIVIGASAGGIDALSRLLSRMPSDLPAPIVVAQHLDPTRISYLAEILARHSSLPVRAVTEGEALAAGTVYVVPSDRDVEIADHRIALRAGTPSRPKPSIDLLFTSAAAIFGERLIAVVLTGTGTDGVDGARRVKEAGGTVIIQDPGTASYPGLPAALAPSMVDVVAELEAIGPLLRDLLTRAQAPPSPDEEARLRRLLEGVRARTGVDFGAYRQPTIRRRLQRRMADTGNEALEKYARYLQRHPEEYQHLVGSFLIKVTDFFRDAELFERLRGQLLPELLQEARAAGKELRVWSAGCATGEEAYSLAILVAELLGDELDEFLVRVFATDLDADAVTYARRGVYPPAALEHVPPELRSRYFIPTDGSYELRKSVRQLVLFAQHDLSRRPPFPRIDLVLCRNVLIYFAPEMQRRILQMFAFALRPGGALILGKAETTTPLPEYFELADGPLKIFRRRTNVVPIPSTQIKDTRTGPGEAVSAGPGLAAPRLGLPRALQVQQAPRTRGEAADRLLLELPIGVVVVDRRYDVQAINAAARRLLSIHTAPIGEDLIHVARRVPAEPLRSVIDRAFEGRAATERIEARHLEHAPGSRRLLEVSAIPHANEEQGGALPSVALLISDVTPTEQEPRAAEPPLQAQREALARALAEIEALTERLGPAAEAADALGAARAALQAVISDLDRLGQEFRELEDAKRELLEANQQLVSANTELREQVEEALVANEEAQAAMEEVETLSEEQQASNEELESLNEELQATVEELNTTNDDLEARGRELQEATARLEFERSRLATILAGLADAVLVVDRAGGVLQTNPAFDQMFAGGADFVPEDERGQSLPPEAWPQRRAAAGETFTMEFTRRAADGARRWYEANARPIEHDGQQGGVIVIRDITDRSLLRLQEEFMAMASHELRTPLTALQGYLQLHLRRLQRGDKRNQLLDSATVAAEQAERMKVLVDDLLDVARLQAGRLSLRPERIDLVPLVERAVELTRSLSEAQPIRLAAPPAPMLVNGDPVRLEQVLMNLLNNAITHAAQSGPIDVSLAAVGEEAELQVRDQGPGIPAASRAELFSRFRQSAGVAPSRSGGLGLGLYIAREIVTAHGGTLSAESAEGPGTRFVVRLPRATHDARD